MIKLSVLVPMEVDMSLQEGLEDFQVVKFVMPTTGEVQRALDHKLLEEAVELQFGSGLKVYRLPKPYFYSEDQIKIVDHSNRAEWIRKYFTFTVKQGKYIFKEIGL